MNNKEKNRIQKIKNWWKSNDALETKEQNKKRLIDYNLSEEGRKNSSNAQIGRVKTQEEKEKIGLATKERFSDPTFVEKHKKATSLANKKKWEDPEYKAKALKYWRPKNKDTKIERLVKEELIKRNIRFQQNVAFPEFRTIPDFYIPSLKTIIYCDGKYWHSSYERQIADSTQVRELSEAGYVVRRLDEEEILNDVERCLDDIGLGTIKRKKIMIGIPTASANLHRKFVQSLMQLKYPPGADVDINIVEGYQLPFARNRIVQQAIEKNCDYLFFIDADMVFPPDTLLRLLSHNVPMVNALAFRRIKPHYPCIFKWNEKEGSYETVAYYGGLQEVDATGMPAILIKTEVFKKMKQPWYYYRDNLFSSDLTFCENARKLGYKILIDTDLKIGHIGEEVVITEEYYLNHLSQEAKEQWNKGMREGLASERADFKENNPSQ